MKIIDVTVMINQGSCDKISLAVNLPSPFPSQNYDPYFTMETEAGHGIEYAKAHFAAYKIKVIDAKTGQSYAA